jgi:Leucine-rich repeat (LRR) protein
VSYGLGLPNPKHNINSGLTELYLSYNQIVDVSALTLPDGLTELDLYHNQIVEVSPPGAGLTLPEGFRRLYLQDNQIVDVSALTLPDGCKLYS